MTCLTMAMIAETVFIAVYAEHIYRVMMPEGRIFAAISTVISVNERYSSKSFSRIILLGFCQHTILIEINFLRRKSA